MQRIDFEPEHCGPGTVLACTPGIAHSFGPHSDWEVWVVAFLPEFAWPTACPGAELGGVIRLTEMEMQVVTGCFMQMGVDAWLGNPQNQIIARDRGSAYGLAAAKALPDAMQVADRWHLMENASRAFLDTVRNSMRQIRKILGATRINAKLLTAPNAFNIKAIPGMNRPTRSS